MKTPAEPLPSRPNLDHLRSQAKALLADLRAGKLEAARTFISHLPAARSMKPVQVRAAGFQLADAQSAIARKSGFRDWSGLARHVQQLRFLEGEWAFATMEIDGVPSPVPSFPTGRFLIDGDLFRVDSPEATYEGKFTINVEQDPPHIDIEFIEGPEAGEWSYGIYTLDGDDLTLCLGLTGSPRPARFVTTAGSGHALQRLHRVSAVRPKGVTGGTRTPRAEVAANPVDASTFTQPMTPLLENLQGNWLPISLVNNGKPLPDAYLAYGSRTQTGNETRVVFGGQAMVHALMKLDESTSPIAIDYLNIGKGPRAVSFGIVEWIGDDFRVCMAKPGDPRPSDFSCEPGSGRTVSVWRRS